MTHDIDDDGKTDLPITGDIQTRLGEKLKEAYADVLNEPVPDRFVELLSQLEKHQPPGRNET
ncbi:MAG: NepR family anti-sigma factor [Ahrensia sp.]|nr:NepR family anti-sigma factor [Ahrensia sp.]